jgi:septal ring factor EnvC (AmiA/AmiB activator)
LTGRCAVPYGAAMLDVPKAMNLDNLKLLETKIDQFVDQHERVREEHEALLQRVRDKEKQLAEATALLKQYEQERSEMRGRLERILSRLEGLDLT